MKENSVLEMKNIYKSFPGVKALQAVDFTLCEGEIHALMGENGAGKSTLIKVLTGVYEKDGGDIFLKEHEGAVAIRSPHRILESVRCTRRLHSVRTFPWQRTCTSDVEKESDRTGRR